MSEGAEDAGRVLAGRYRLLSHVGRGGMGTVWQARDEVLDRDVALKEVLVHAGLSDAERDVLHERTKREARATARLSHPGIVTIHDVVEEDGRPWIVMEFVRARSLQDIIDAEGPLPPAQVADIGRQLIGALRTAHTAGILHRDVKPANVLLLREDHEDRAVLTDFGIAQVEGDSTLTATGLVMGSPAYIAPERARGDRATPATDLWALGATLYAACDGRPPHERRDAMSTLGAVLTMDAPPPQNAGPLTPVLMGLLHRDPVERLTAETAAHLLTQVMAAPEEGTRPVPLAPAAPPWADSPGGLRTETRPGTRRAVELPLGASGPPAPPLRLPEYPMPGTAPRPARRKITSGLLVAVALLAAAVVALTAFLVLRPHGGTGTSGTQVVQPGGAGPPRTARASHPATTARLPAGWRTVKGPGYTIAVPARWRHLTGRSSMIWRDPDSAAFVQVDRTAWTGDPYRHWQDWEPKAIADGALRSYHRVALDRVTGPAYEAADLEFTYVTSSGAAMHAVDRGVRAGGKSFAVFVSVPVGQWTSRTDNTDNFLTSFRP